MFRQGVLLHFYFGASTGCCVWCFTWSLAWCFNWSFAYIIPPDFIATLLFYWFINTPRHIHIIQSHTKQTNSMHVKEVNVIDIFCLAQRIRELVSKKAKFDVSARCIAALLFGASTGCCVWCFTWSLAWCFNWSFAYIPPDFIATPLFYWFINTLNHIHIIPLQTKQTNSMHVKEVNVIDIFCLAQRMR